VISHLSGWEKVKGKSELYGSIYDSHCPSRLVKALFDLARERKPSIIFVDEIDALCGSREARANDYSTGMKAEFLVQMDGVGRDSSGVLVLAATNLPWVLDPAIRRRFQLRIHIGLPDMEARTHMFEIAAGDIPCDVSADDYASLGRMTEGFSGSDISIVVQEALMQPVKEIYKATHYRKVSNSSIYKCLFLPPYANILFTHPLTQRNTPGQPQWHRKADPL
jgi:vacuolar protein-sorting-associated protein 4